MDLTLVLGFENYASTPFFGHFNLSATPIRSDLNKFGPTAQDYIEWNSVAGIRDSATQPDCFILFRFFSSPDLPLLSFFVIIYFFFLIVFVFCRVIGSLMSSLGRSFSGTKCGDFVKSFLQQMLHKEKEELEIVIRYLLLGQFPNYHPCIG